MTRFRILAALAALNLSLACGAAQDDVAESDADNQGASVSVEAAKVRGRLQVPAPTGPHAVGVRRTFVVDASRIDPTTQKPRALPTWIYYPATRASASAPARYLPAAVQTYTESMLGFPAGALDVDSGVLENARPRAKYRGVLLVSPGWASPVAFNTALITELASQGWVLVAFDHPQETVLVEQPDGTNIEGLQLADEAAFAPRVLDVKIVLQQLPVLVQGFEPSTPVAMWGHSMGGATALEALRLYPRLRAAVDLDGTPRGRVVELGTHEPVGVMSSNVAIVHIGEPDPILMQLISNLRGPHRSKNMYDISHYGFSDFVLFNPVAAARDPNLGAVFENAFETDSETIGEGRAAIATQRQFLVDFMDRFVDKH